MILNSVLIRTMRRAGKRRRMLLSHNRTTESRNLSESNRTTMMLVMVVGLFLTVELPGGILSITYICNVYFLNQATHNMLATFINFLCSFLLPVQFIHLLCHEQAIPRDLQKSFQMNDTRAEDQPIISGL